MRRLAPCLIVLVVLAATVGEVQATVGFAEWEVYTPGGHLISHVDGFKEEHGDCLRAEGNRGEVFVSNLRRWRFHSDHVVGETKTGFFIFDERNERVRAYRTESALESATRKLQIGPPASPWLNAQDGWREAWFPFVVWKPCTDGTAQGRVTSLTGESCAEALRPERLARYRATTWGRICRKAPRTEPTTDEGRTLREFCSSLLRTP